MAVCFILPLVAVLLYHNACFGSPFATAYGFRVHKAEQHVGVLFGFGLPTWARIKALLISEREGILLLCPILIFAPFGFVHLWANGWLRHPSMRPRLRTGHATGFCF